MTNKLGMSGVWITKSGKYIASIKLGGKKRYLGSFDTIEKAGRARAKAVKDLYGAFARDRW